MTDPKHDPRGYERLSVQRTAAPDDPLVIGAPQESALRAALERLWPYLAHEPDCASRTPEGDCVCGMATAVDAVQHAATTATSAQPKEPKP